MKQLFIGMTLGKDPHTLGIYNAGKIASLAGVDFNILPPNTSDDEKIRFLQEKHPRYVGLSYRLSPDKAITELKSFMEKLQVCDDWIVNSKLCFAGLEPTLNAIHEMELDKKYHLHLMRSYSNINDTTRQTALFFDVVHEEKLKKIVSYVRKEREPEKIEILDQISKDVIAHERYHLEPRLRIPSEKAKKDMICRIDESEIPLVRSHFGIPGESIEPTVLGIKNIAENCVVDEISIGSSDLSQRYYGEPAKFKEMKNDGGVPYKDKDDLRKLMLASRQGNFPAVKPYCHVKNITEFIDDCLDVGMLIGGHQAIPLFWFNELDGRGDMSLEQSIDKHIQAVSYLAQKGIPVEMNDPNQWSSRYIHDTLFVVSYALIASVMFQANVKNIIIQCQFNKPAATGDYADLGKYMAVKKMIETLRPYNNSARIIYEGRSGIEHFSTDLELAKLQLPRSVMLQMIIKPKILHLVSYCEADHIATVDDITESSKILRCAVRLYQENEQDILKTIKWDIIEQRAEWLFDQAMIVLRAMVNFENKKKTVPIKEFYNYLSRPSVLIHAITNKYLTAPGITCKRFQNDEIITKFSKYGFLDCYRNWDDNEPLLEQERIKN